MAEPGYEYYDGAVVAEEVHRRSPATRSYSQAQARRLFERAGLEGVELYHEFSGEPITADDTTFTVIGKRTGSSELDAAPHAADARR